ncbi:MAG TPA: flagellar assembly peptidoglycan hydrolase FlgJ [Steroidobacter sp.]|jgi:flagellar protein FlgJ|nr:flagellar assembly peptidoglycan hydrolase FlgJ [Steroidobacteraceae bacterium]HLS82557.1 flagellar assembly peptidoglycan hydrolase FlgJ [Steroidobacter sp.]
MAASVNISSLYDSQSLAGLKREARAQDPAALREAARQFESLFTRMLLKSMREASSGFGDSLFGSDQTRFYQEMFDDQIAVQLSQGEGLGLADLLIRQLASGGRERGGAVEATKPAAVQGASASAGGPTAVASDKDDFIRTMYPHAVAAGRKIGVHPSALLAQAALETGWGRSVPCKANGECSFNLFGVKASGGWKGAVAGSSTLEFEDGVAVRRTEKFRAYASPAESFMDYATLIASSPRYQAVRGTGGDIVSFAAALQDGGYATDPQYAHKIVQIAAEIKEAVSG